MKPEYNVARFTAPARNTWCGKGRVILHGCVIRRGYCDGYSATKKDQQWKFPKKCSQAGEDGTLSGHSSLYHGLRSHRALRFLFGRGNSVESESLELELESAKTFARHMLLGE